MKRILAVLIAMLLICSLCAPVMADLIIAPKILMDDFLEAHIGECERIGCRYEAREETEIRVSPEDETLLGTVNKGDSVLIAYGWNGWGLIETGDGFAGWISMRDMRRLFDGTAFTEKYGGEVKEVDGELFLDFKPGDSVPLYSFPGSGEIVDRMDTEVTTNASVGQEDENGEHGFVVSYTKLWEDERGRSWGYVENHEGHSGWVCISDPYTELQSIWPESMDVTIDPAPAPERIGFPTLTVALVTAAVGGTVTALVVMTRKNRKTAE